MKIIIIVGIMFFFNACAMIIPDSVYHEMFHEIFEDMDMDKSKTITYKELYIILKDDEESIVNAKKEGLNMKDYVHKEFNKVDLDRDGNIIYREFYKMAIKKVKYD